MNLATAIRVCIQVAAWGLVGGLMACSSDSDGGAAGASQGGNAGSAGTGGSAGEAAGAAGSSTGGNAGSAGANAGGAAGTAAGAAGSAGAAGAHGTPVGGTCSKGIECEEFTCVCNGKTAQMSLCTTSKVCAEPCSQFSCSLASGGSCAQPCAGGCTDTCNVCGSTGNCQ